tara:strand:+ start:46198 stop:46950 length:753 start_codon:yes stop_codon:yes gene_type:complete
MQLRDKVAIITGASSGIGESAALLFAANGASLVLGARREVELEALAARIGRAGGRAVALAGDVKEASYAAALVDLALAEFGGLDVGFNNAGTVGQVAPIPKMADADWELTLATNLTSAFHSAKYQVPAMTARGGGSIIFTSSFVGHTAGIPGMGAYAASKAGLIGLVQVLAAEHAPAGVRANALLPGGTLTPMAGTDPGYLEWARSIHALKRLAQPEEIAKAALFLASDGSSFVTGTALLADGGCSIHKV